MSVNKNESGTWTAVVYNPDGKRIERRFKKKIDADSFETFTQNQKREKRLVHSNLKKASVSIESACADYLLAKPELRNKSKVKYENIILQFKEFCKTRKI